MKSEEIENFEKGSHCFGKILNINGKDYIDFKKEELKELLIDMIDTDMNADHLLRECIELSLEYKQADLVEDEFDSCEQCDDSDLPIQIRGKSLEFLPKNDKS